MTFSNEREPVIDITNLNEKVYELIKSRIITLKSPPGCQINVRKLQDELGVSNSPIKSALFRLAGEGMVEISSRRGAFVKDITERDMYEVEEARIVLEIGAVEIIAEKITDDQLERLERLFKDTLFDDEEHDYKLFMEKDNLFHLEIIKLTDNQRLLDMYKRLNAHMQIVRFRFTRGRSKRLPWTDQDHRNILDALKSRDATKAKTFIKEHRLKARETFLQYRKELEALSGS